jgi:hypothetical protein
VDLSANTMGDAAAKVADGCGILVALMKKRMLEGGCVRADETFIRYLDGLAAGGSSTGYFWVYRGLGGDVIFDWQTSREHHHVADWLGSGYEGILQSDGYEAYRNYCLAQSLRGKKVTRAACLAHIRRYFEKAKDEKPGVVGWILRIIAQLYRIETPLREHGASAEVRARVRGNRSRPLIGLLEKAFKYLITTRILPKSQLGQALQYALGQWPEMWTFLDDGRVEIDNNDTENDIRPSAVGKKNWLFVGSPEAGRRSAVLYTLLISARNHGVDPQAYLRAVIEHLPTARPDQLDALLPASKHPRERRAKNLGRRAGAATLGACHEDATPRRRRGSSWGNSSGPEAVPRHSAGSTDWPTRLCWPGDASRRVNYAQPRRWSLSKSRCRDPGSARCKAGRTRLLSWFWQAGVCCASTLRTSPGHDPHPQHQGVSGHRALRPAQELRHAVRGGARATRRGSALAQAVCLSEPEL